MRMTLKFKEDLVSLLDHVQTKKNGEGDPWSDTKISRLSMGYGDFVGILRKWDGGKGSPTLEKVLKFESFLQDQLSPDEYQQFVASREADKHFDD